MPAPTTATSRMESKTGGKAIQISTAREIIASTQPPRQPARRPSVDPSSAGETCGDESDGESDARAVNHPRQNVAAEIVGAQPMSGLRAYHPGRRRGAQDDILLQWISWREPGRKDRQDKKEEDEPAANRHLRIGEAGAKRIEASVRGVDLGGAKRGVSHDAASDWSAPPRDRRPCSR